MTSGTAALLGFIVGFGLGAVVAGWYGRRQTAGLAMLFRGIAAEVTASTRAAFVDECRGLAAQQAEGAGAVVKALVDPVREQLEHLRRSAAANTARTSQEVGRLAEETGRLQQVLGNARMRGAWGEQHLRNAIEAAGVARHVDFTEQTTTGGEARLRPDVVVSVPGGANVVIDAKTPLDSYRRAVESASAEERKGALEAHAAALRAHAKELGRRDYSRYWRDSPGFVLMYVPTDPMLDAAMDVDGELWQWAWTEHKVLITTPGLLIAFLRTVAMAWERQDVQRNADRILETAGELHARLARLGNDLDAMGKGLAKAVRSFNDGVGAYRSRVMVSAGRLADLGAAGAAATGLKPPAPVDVEAREVSAATSRDGGGRLRSVPSGERPGKATAG